MSTDNINKNFDTEKESDYADQVVNPEMPPEQVLQILQPEIKQFQPDDKNLLPVDCEKIFVKKNSKNQYNKNYYEKNKQKVLNKSKERVVCSDCNMSLARSHLPRHCLSELHIANRKVADLQKELHESKLEAKKACKDARRAQKLYSDFVKLKDI